MFNFLFFLCLFETQMNNELGKNYEGEKNVIKSKTNRSPDVSSNGRMCRNIRKTVLRRITPLENTVERH